MTASDSMLPKRCAQVQGVFFRAHTVEKAKQLGIVGWVRNTKQDTVEGEAQGEKAPMQEFKVRHGCIDLSAAGLSEPA